jgi:diguanylate cyclase (GGDEF)-like protein/PAS domain S-box-containing protein
MRIRPTVQMSLGLALLTSAVLLVVDLLFGVFTDPDVELMRLRKALAESAATQAAVLLERGDHKTLGITLARIRDQDPSIRSLAVRRADHTLLAQSGNHRQTWTGLEGDRSTLTQLLVPLGVGRERWGSFEVAYFPDDRSALQRTFGHPLGVTLLGIALLGTLVYWQYIRRALVHLDPKAVIPERVRLAFDVMTEGVVVLDSRGRVLLANRAFRALPGDESSDLAGKQLSELPWLAAGLPAAAAEHPWTRAMRAGQPVMDFAIEVAPHSETGKKLVVNCAPISDPRGAVRGCVATFDDLTALHFANERLSDALAELRASRDEISKKNVELEHMATHDVLTGCLSRGAFFQRMAQAWEDARRTGRPLSCLALDIDKFKSVNDGFGHAAGDRVIQEIGSTLVSALRAADIVGRYGGDEFFVGMPGCALDQGLAIADKLRRAIEERCSTSFRDLAGLRVTVSIGIATSCGDDGALAELIERADLALYDAKSNGRNQVAASAASSAQAAIG